MRRWRSELYFVHDRDSDDAAYKAVDKLVEAAKKLGFEFTGATTEPNPPPEQIEGRNLERVQGRWVRRRYGSRE
jgi:hypothetical protein